MSTYKWAIWLLPAGLLLIGMAASPPRQDATPTSTGTVPTAPLPTAPLPTAPLPTAPLPTVPLSTVPLPTVTLPPANTAETTFPPAFPTWVSPTPDATGAIVVIVQPGESMWVIAARAGISLPELLALNNLSAAAVINPGDLLVVGYVTPPALAPDETTPTATPPPPTPQLTAPRPEATVCLTAFDDLNQDGIHDPGEPLRPGVAFTIYNTQSVVANYITDGVSEPKCLGGLLPGQYRVTRSLMPGEVLTTAGDWSLNLAAGAELRQSFGSFAGQARTAVPPDPAAVAAAAGVTSTPGVLSTPATLTSPTTGDNNFGRRLLAVIALFLGGLLLFGAVIILLVRQSLSRPGSGNEPNTSNGKRQFRDIDDLE